MTPEIYTLSLHDALPILAVLSGNSIENAVISFAAMAIGVILAPISPNYTLMPGGLARLRDIAEALRDRKSTRLNSSHLGNSYAVFCLKKKKTTIYSDNRR